MGGACQAAKRHTARGQGGRQPAAQPHTTPPRHGQAPTCAARSAAFCTLRLAMMTFAPFTAAPKARARPAPPAPCAAWGAWTRVGERRGGGETWLTPTPAAALTTTTIVLPARGEVLASVLLGAAAWRARARADEMGPSGAGPHTQVPQQQLRRQTGVPCPPGRPAHAGHAAACI